MTVETTRVEGIEVRWTPAEVLAIQTAGLRDMEADPAAPYVPGIERDCAMAKCERAAEGPPLVVNVATMPGPFAVDLCHPCREPFESGMEATERLVAGDAEAQPYRFNGRHAAQLEAER
jgi:hypothetical protein